MEPGGINIGTLGLAILGLSLSIGFALFGITFAIKGGRAFVSISRMAVNTAKAFEDKADLDEFTVLSEEMKIHQKTIIPLIENMKTRIEELEKVTPTKVAVSKKNKKKNTRGRNRHRGQG